MVLHGNALNKATFLHRRVNTQILLHRGAFTHRRTGASTHWCLYTAMRLHTCAFAQGCFLHRGASTHRGLYGQILSHKDIFTTIYLHRRFFAQIILQRGAFTRKYFYRISQREREREIHTIAFTERCLYTQCLSTGRGSYTGMVLNREILMQRILLHTGPLTQRCFQHRDAFAHRRLHIEIRSQKDALIVTRSYADMLLYTGAVAHTYSYTEML